ncbi:DUF418 domain-containing protein [Corynebacterium sp. TA-R-1]|uniref:DUF418 domain-containing protein n=1 Tax=Corynebacterium stercoris TaxID=2943490 RepID=A0ABT1G273_9CORY|nr:DUF418 domain-containing protein [Corynebacterium stercoris]
MNRQTQSQPRLIVPDLARGLALAGIAMANAVQAWLLNGYDEAGGPGSTLGGVREGNVADQFAAVFSAMFVHVRGLPMFSTLLGFGIGLIAASLYRKGYPAKDARRVLLRRYGILALFGLAHMFLLFMGDIMAVYGVTGMVVALLFTCSTKTLRIIAYLSLIASALFGVIGAVGLYFFEAAALPVEMMTLTTDITSVGDYFRTNATDGLFMLASVPFAVLQLGGLVLIGYVWAREGYLVNVDQHRRILWTWVGVGTAIVLLIGLPWGLSGIGVLDPQLELSLSLLNSSLGTFTGPAILAGLALVTNNIQKGMNEQVAETGRSTAPAWAYPFVALGKRSMSGYLAQSFLFILLVMPFTLGWGLQASVSGKLLVGLAVWVITLALAVVLEGTGTPGPFEQVHRRLSYGPTKRLEPYSPAALPVAPELEQQSQ